MTDGQDILNVLREARARARSLGRGVQLRRHDAERAQDEIVKLRSRVAALERAAGHVRGAQRALKIIERFGGTDEVHHARWVIDQVARALLGDEYPAWVVRMRADGDDPDAYEWDGGVPP